MSTYETFKREHPWLLRWETFKLYMTELFHWPDRGVNHPPRGHSTPQKEEEESEDQVNTGL